MRTVWFIGFIVLFLVMSVVSSLLVLRLPQNLIKEKSTWKEELSIYAVTLIFIPASVYLTTRNLHLILLLEICGALLLSVAVDFLMTAIAGGNKTAALRHLLAVELEAELNPTARLNFLQIVAAIVFFAFPVAVGIEYYSDTANNVSRTVIGGWAVWTFVGGLFPVRYLGAKNLAEDARTRAVIAPLAQYIFILGLIYIAIWQGEGNDAGSATGLMHGNAVVLVILMGMALLIFVVVFVVPYAVGTHRAALWANQLSYFESNSITTIVTVLNRPRPITGVRDSLTKVVASIAAERTVMMEREGLAAIVNFVAYVNEQIEASKASQSNPASPGDIPTPSVGQFDRLRRDLFVRTLESDPRQLHVFQLDEITSDLAEICQRLSDPKANEETMERLGASYSRVQAQRVPQTVAAGEHKPRLVVLTGSVISLLTPLASEFGNGFLSSIVTMVRPLLGF
ncbi:MAG: hypothetical protein ABSE20_23695 [Acetobacteraceae bacterium]|jgi:hypothetical protein